MVTSGAYKLDERVIQGYILESRNPIIMMQKRCNRNKLNFSRLLTKTPP